MSGVGAPTAAAIAPQIYWVDWVEYVDCGKPLENDRSHNFKGDRKHVDGAFRDDRSRGGRGRQTDTPRALYYCHSSHPLQGMRLSINPYHPKETVYSFLATIPTTM